MDLLRIAVVTGPAGSADARLHLLGTRALLDQEGMFYQEYALETLDVDGPEADVVLVVDHMGPESGDQTKIARWAERAPLVWVGVPRADLVPGLRAVLSLPALEIDTSCRLRRLDLNTHPITSGTDWPEERHLFLNHQEHIRTWDAALPPGVSEVATVRFVDGERLGAGILASEEAPRRVLFGFPLGKLVAANTSRHGWVRSDLRGITYPLYATVDVLRVLLRSAILWCAPDRALVRKYYWPAADRVVPQGSFLLNHDLCNWHSDGAAWIRRFCREQGITTTFFDPPFYGAGPHVPARSRGARTRGRGEVSPFRLTRETADGHDVALHMPDNSTLEQLKRAKAELERVQGRPVLGWGRHGPTDQDSYPGIWRHAVAAGFRWSRTFAVQTNLSLSLSEATATGDRLPHMVFDLETAEVLQIWELPGIDSQDGERAVNYDYGGGLDWHSWLAFVARRMDFTQKHCLVCGYLLHGGSAALPPDGRRTHADYHAFVDYRRMARAAVEMARERGFAIMSHTDLYTWWSYRESVRGEATASGLELHLPGGGYSVVLEILGACDRPAVALIDGERVPLESQPIPARLAPGGDRTLLVLAASPAGGKLVIGFGTEGGSGQSRVPTQDGGDSD